MITGTFFQSHDYNLAFSVVHLLWSLLLKPGALILCRLVWFLKCQNCWWLNEYVCVFLYHQSNSAGVYWTGCFYQNENGCFALLEFIFVGNLWNIVHLLLSCILSTVSFFVIFLILRLLWLSPWFLQCLSIFLSWWTLLKWWGWIFSVFRVELIMSALILLFTLFLYL